MRPGVYILENILSSPKVEFEKKISPIGKIMQIMG
jgi:hypothetical protein